MRQQLQYVWKLDTGKQYQHFIEVDSSNMNDIASRFFIQHFIGVGVSSMGTVCR
jgi:hypothetical protein